MNIFSGTYSWDGKKHGTREPIAWFPGAYELRIFNLSRGKEGVTHLREHLCIFSETGRGHSVSANPIKFAQHVSEDFSLDMNRVLWVEKLKGPPERFEVIVPQKSSRIGERWLYDVSRREPSEAEMAMIQAELGKSNDD